jgi:hypothetical protein
MRLRGAKLRNRKFSRCGILFVMSWKSGAKSRFALSRA